ncbi:hypothetical protein L228DRAFT_224304 [Xylona heveae TC161]|uniref:Histone transcription regulator 3 homolog n=1 Tax=Xylona heveae (strain CBS 132557 / TC161) TaxID=1328760 RepID=A0A164ZY28_XYLHT|nr:hypothetical protein L228DRAFT_224304 [Xylona heveae TC161]KZF19684.1 hypothetical protein L228DRAFT_224304 [Xylona heveae TC161]
MSSFAALNIEPDDDSDIEIDDTKEIQVEEALKLYQTALKLHSQGPEYFPEASEAYLALFRSEIFKYPESLSEAQRHELHGTLVGEEADSRVVESAPLALPHLEDGAAPSTLPHILFLSFKNHGQFVLDYLKYHIANAKAQGGESGPEAEKLRGDISTSALKTLEYFAEALERDDSDIELWRRTARVGDVLGSRRIERYCLETVLEGDDGDFEDAKMPVHPEEGFAGEQLKELLRNIFDTLSFKLSPIVELDAKRIITTLRKYMDPYPYLPSGSEDYMKDHFDSSPLGRAPKLYTLKPMLATWAAVGKAILQHLAAEQHGILEPGPGAGIKFSIPGAEEPIENESTREDDTDGVAAQLQKEIAAADEVHERERTRSKSAQHMSSMKDDPTMDEKITKSPSQQASPEAETKEASGQQTLSNPTTNILPVRKRSSDAAGMAESADGGRLRSKRLRARESVAEGTVGEDADVSELAKQHESQLNELAHADHWMFETIGSLLRRLEVESLGDSQSLKDALQTEDRPSWERTTAADLLALLKGWDEAKGNAFVYADDPDDISGGSRNPGLTAFMEHAKGSNRKASVKPLISDGHDVLAFARQVNQTWSHIKEVAFEWLQCLVRSNGGTLLNGVTNTSESTYLCSVWPDALKEVVVQIIVSLDDYVESRVLEELSSLENRILQSIADSVKYTFTASDHAAVEIVQTLFELHLDIYASITNPSSEVDKLTRILQKDRLDKWAGIASRAMHLRSANSPLAVETDDLSIRFLWASTFCANQSEDVSREHILICLEDLKHLLEAGNKCAIQLQNNALMPEISVADADREISRLTTMDYFFHIFDADTTDPVAVIESLEPVLDPGNYEYDHAPASADVARSASHENVSPENISRQQSPEQGSLLAEMSNFLDRGSASLRLLLWRRLQEAYETISYSPKVLICYLQSITIIMNEFQKPAYLESSLDERFFILLKWIRALDDLLSKTLDLLDKEPTAFDCFILPHGRSAMHAIAKLLRLLHSFTLQDDLIRIGVAQPFHTQHQLSIKSFNLLMNKLRELYVRGWIVEYCLLKEGISQTQELFPNGAEDLYDCLRTMHYSLGLRSLCETARKAFPTFMKNELLKISKSDGWEGDLGQVIYDIHGLKLCPNPVDLQEHGTSPEPLSRDTAIQIMDLVMSQVRDIAIKDLPKTELKPAIDKMHQVIGIDRHNLMTSHNRRVLGSYLKSPINPVQLYRSIKGIGDLSMVPVPPKHARVAEKGWYFLLGHLALSRFRSVKRVTQTPTDELDSARLLFKQDLEFNRNNWETWYRLAQVYDLKIDEDVMWSAEKINNSSRELVMLQRSSIHCYSMALATAIKYADSSFETASKLSDLYTDFGIRMYASSRPPFNMEAFAILQDRFFTGLEGMYKESAFRGLSKYATWKFASFLFRRALVEKPNNWMNHYMLAKCLWKMHSFEYLEFPEEIQIDAHEVIDTIIHSIDCVPERKDSRQDPIFEPHYKLVSIVHKLVTRGTLEPDQGQEFLNATPYAAKAAPLTEKTDWVPFILRILKVLRTADKANWHHRMVARAAQINLDDAVASKESAARLAKEEFTQHIFTKTMALQVWKPEYERVGRHFVYTSRYIRTFSQILVDLEDRSSLEAIVKRLRKRTSEYIDHTKLWQDVCSSYMQLLRRLGEIPENHEESVFKNITHEEFQTAAARLETWCKSNYHNSTLNTLRDAMELKKLNSGMMKPVVFDDLVADTYAVLYGTVMPQLAPPTTNGSQDSERKDMMSLNNLLMSADESSEQARSTAAQQETGPKPRVKGVGRREIQRKADAAVAAAFSTAARTSKSATSAPQQTVPEVEEDKEDLSKDDNAQGAVSSVPGSVHDSADDESELSDVEEDKIAEPMFPNLGTRSGNRVDELGEEEGDDETGQDEMTTGE